MMLSTDDLASRLAVHAVTRESTSATEAEKARVVLSDAVIQGLITAHNSFGRQTSPSESSIAAFVDNAPVGDSVVIGHTKLLNLDDAVFVNSALIHMRLTDDAHPYSLVHPGSIVVPTALAIGAQRGVEYDVFVRSLIAGYRTMNDLALPVAGAVAARGLRNTAVFGPGAAAMTAASLFGLNQDRARLALMLALGSSGGSLQAFHGGTNEWRVQPGLATRVGIAAARFAEGASAEDLRRAEHSIEGPGGVYESLIGDAEKSLNGERDGLLEITHKLHATCGANQGAAETFASLQHAHGWTLADIAHIDISLDYSAYNYPGTNSYGPFTIEGGFLSRPLAIAAILLTGDRWLTDNTFRNALDDAQLDHALRCVQSRPREAGEPGHPQSARVTVTLADGTTVGNNGLSVIDALRVPDMDARLASVPPSNRERAVSFWAALNADSPPGPADLVKRL